MRAYLSCNCKNCRSRNSVVKGHHKRNGHRALRRTTRLAIRTGGEMPVTAYTGYKA